MVVVKMVCPECNDLYEDDLKEVPMYCPDCGVRTTSAHDPEPPTETKSDRI